MPDSVYKREHEELSAIGSERFTSNEDLKLFAKRTRQNSLRHVYVNCWHANDHESAAMWSMYSNKDEVVALKTTYSKLRDALSDKSFLGRIRYLDFSNADYPTGNDFHKYFTKRMSFEHEKEVRAIWIAPHQPELPSGEIIKAPDLVETPEGRRWSINLSEVIDSVYIAPTASHLFFSTIVELTEKLAPSLRVLPSSLISKPLL